ncbi:unnamed protein product, partial [Rotaria sp. Silwood1]
MKYKEQTDKGRIQDSMAKQGAVEEKVTEILSKDSNNYYTCPNCNGRFKPPEITGH